MELKAYQSEINFKRMTIPKATDSKGGKGRRQTKGETSQQSWRLGGGGRFGGSRHVFSSGQKFNSSDVRTMSPLQFTPNHITYNPL